MQESSSTQYNPEILLINPPFGPISNPYISIPVLVSYLRNRDIAVSAYDLKREFYVNLLTPQNILNGLNHSKERFRELNDQSKLNFPELFEYWMHSILLSEMQTFKQEIEKLCYPFADFSDVQNSKVIHSFIRAATFPYFPEVIIPDFIFGIGSEYTPHSSSDLLAASHEKNCYTRIFETIIADQIVPRYNPRIVGFSVVFTTQIIPAFQCARLLKNYLPHVHITLGGPCISTYFRKIQEEKFFTCVDSLVLDEGEIPLEKLSNVLKSPNPDFNDIPGLVYLTEQGIRCNPPAPPLDMEQSAPPDYTVFQLDKYLFTGKRLAVPFRLSKGCPWQKCTFCRTDLSMCRNYQQPSAEFVYQQLMHVVENSRASSIFFSDESANPAVLEYISERLLEDHIKIHWFAHSRVSKQITKARCELYRKAGCIGMTLGIESFSDRILALMKKGITAKLIEKVLTEIAGVLSITAYMIAGFPTETEEEARTSYEKLRYFVSKRFLRGYYYSTFRIYYGSDIWKHPDTYEISEMVIPEGNDLFPDVIDFHSAGISREAAHRLGLEFNRPFDPLSRNVEIRGVQIGATSVSAKYDIKKIADLCAKRSFTILPFVQWLKNTDAIIYPSMT